MCIQIKPVIISGLFKLIADLKLKGLLEPSGIGPTRMKLISSSPQFQGGLIIWPGNFRNLPLNAGILSGDSIQR